MKTFEIIIVVSIPVTFMVAFGITLYHSPAIRQWFGGAFAAFIDGFVDGMPVGSPAGAGIAAADGQMTTELSLRHIAIEAAHVLAIPFFTGLSDVRAFHQKNRFPNPFNLTNEENKNPPIPAATA